ncbi:MAG: hypothetical protein V8R95_11975 [Faecalibacterium sp.]
MVPVQAGAVLIQKRRKKKRAEWGYAASVGGSVAAGDAAEHHEVAHGIAAEAVAANGYGIGFLSGELLEHLNNAVPFNAFPLRDCTLPLESVAAWRAGNYLPRYALAFIERMEQLENQKYNNSATKVH